MKLKDRWLLTIITTIFANMAYAASELPATMAEPPTNEIWYTTTDGEKITIDKADVFGATIISNKRYTNGHGAIRGVIAFDNAVTEIGKEAFYGCDNLTTITIPDSVTVIGEGAFTECESLTDVTIGDSVNEISKWAFYKCDNLPTVTIPDSVAEIGGGAFAYCISLKELKGKYAADSGRCLIKNNTIIAYANASGTTYTIPNSVTEIGVVAFLGCESLTSITIPDSVTEIGPGAFSGCTNLNSVVIGDGVQTIGEETFNACVRLQNITFGKGITTLGKEAFHYCHSLESVTIPDNIETIVGSFLFCKNLKKFEGKYVSDNGRILIKDGTLIACVPTADYSNFTIPDNVTKIGVCAFGGCDLTSITIPDSVTEIGMYAFSKCGSLTNITIPDSVTKIGESAFDGCRSLTSITIPDSVTEIGESAFDGCGSLESVYCKATTPPTVVLFNEDYNWDAFYDNAYNRKIYVPRGSVEAYKNADGWEMYADDIVGYDF